MKRKLSVFVSVIFLLVAAVFSLPQSCYAMAKNAEVQVEYLRHRIYARRFIDNYNIHVFQKAHEHAGLTFHRELPSPVLKVIRPKIIFVVTVTR